MNTQDKRKMQMLLEQMQQNKNIVDLEDHFFVHSVDQTGTIGVAGKYNVEKFVWIEPLQVFGVEEATGSKQKYSEKTQQMLEFFSDITHFKHLKAMASIIARDIASQNEYIFPASDYYYNVNKKLFDRKNENYPAYFEAIMKLYKGKTVD